MKYVPLSVLAFLACSWATWAEEPREPPQLTAAALDRFGQPEFVFTGKLDWVEPLGYGASSPPVHLSKLHFAVEEVLRGRLKKGDTIVCWHSIAQRERPEFPEKEVCLVTAKKPRSVQQEKEPPNILRLLTVEMATLTSVAQAGLACEFPFGWSIDEGKLVSPWKDLQEKGWPQAERAKGAIACLQTGRPALFAGKGVVLHCERVSPKRELKFQNPNGDGEYNVSITNTSGERVDVPALLSDGDKILWSESLVVLCQSRAYRLRDSAGVSKKPSATSLGPGESVSTVVNILQFDGPKWPRGGYGIEFQFCLGEKSETQSFYYFSPHHDPLRKEIQSKK